MVWGLLPRKYISHRVKIMRTNFIVEILTFGSPGIKPPPPPLPPVTLLSESIPEVSISNFRFHLLLPYYVIIFWLDPRENVHVYHRCQQLKVFHLRLIYPKIFLRFSYFKERTLGNLQILQIERYFAKELLLTKHFCFLFFFFSSITSPEVTNKLILKYFC